MSENVRLYAGTQHGLITWRSTSSGWQEVARHFEDGIIDSIHGSYTNVVGLPVAEVRTMCSELGILIS